MATITGNNNTNVLTGTSGNDVLRGLGGDDTLRALGGNDRLDGGIGRDTMLGGLGNDTYFVSTPADLVIEDPGAGIDRVLSSVSYTLRADVENLSLTGLAAINGTGNGLGNVIIGNNANNILNGLGGNDVLLGRAGNDRLFGGNGGDRLDGGTGNDILDGGAGNDRMTGGAGNDIYRIDNVNDVVIETATGIDRIDSFISLSLSSGLTPRVENLTLLGGAPLFGVGNPLNNVLTGNSGNNSLAGGNGNDVLIGGLGSDSLTGGLGADIYRYRSIAESRMPFPDSIELGAGQHDRIDLSAIDANAMVAGNQSFTFIGATGFTGPGQVNFATEVDLMTLTSRTTILANVDADPAPEFILVSPSFSILPTVVTAADFIL